MSQCIVNPNVSPTFQKLLADLRKQYPHIDKDLGEAFGAIAQDYRKAKRGRAIPGFRDCVFKYRQNSSDIRRGSSYGFRIVGYFLNGVLYPIIVYAKLALADVDDSEIRAALEEMNAILGFSSRGKA